ncbi:MAG: glutamate synthase subunit alpha, partial [Micromonosporaceae bacterium]|nr:glutamate synthase subunit alpha [Micromonosporaceae bacterium]
ALLGAEEFGFATAPLVTLGCVMMRVCHLDTCPAGIATQNPVLRQRYRGSPDYVVAFFRLLAQEVREYLAALGFRTLGEAVGQVELLDVRRAVDHWKASGLDLAPLLHLPRVAGETSRRQATKQDHHLERALDNALIAAAAPALDDWTPVAAEFTVRNEHRSVGAMLGGEVVRRCGGDGLPPGTIDLTLRGTAGQSFGAFVPRGVTLRLLGDANDYIGKGLSGGRLVLRPDERAPFVAAAEGSGLGGAEDQIIGGNTALYGATSGEVFLRGRVGERFAVRNSGATAVVEGVGDHGCEYMTGGTVVVLGPTGRNFAAGMSGGMAYVFRLETRLVNRELVDLRPLTETELTRVRELVQTHAAQTDSAVARKLLACWVEASGEFTAIIPRDYQKVLDAIALAEDAGPPVVACLPRAGNVGVDHEG